MCHIENLAANTDLLNGDGEKAPVNNVFEIRVQNIVANERQVFYL